jgi:hypothetical protein
MRHTLNEYVKLRLPHVLWVCYCCFVCGCTNGITTKGIFGLPSTALTAFNVRVAIAASEAKSHAIILYVLLLGGFALGSFLSGNHFILFLSPLRLASH